MIGPMTACLGPDYLSGWGVQMDLGPKSAASGAWHVKFALQYLLGSYRRPDIEMASTTYYNNVSLNQLRR